MSERIYILIGAVILILILILSGDRYRYPCQDPENWGSAECDPPLCLASMTCTGYLVRNQDGTQTP